jgi:hypothetical protein
MAILRPEEFAGLPRSRQESVLLLAEADKNGAEFWKGRARGLERILMALAANGPVIVGDVSVSAIAPGDILVASRVGGYSTEFRLIRKSDQ